MTQNPRQKANSLVEIRILDVLHTKHEFLPTGVTQMVHRGVVK